MKLKRSSIIRIAKGKIVTANTVLEPLDYNKWIAFIDQNSDFIWNENTEKGKNTLKNINEIPVKIRDRVLSTLNKGICLSEFNSETGNYNISVTFYEELNWITIQFARTPKPEDLIIFIKMANYLDAYLLLNDTEILNKNMNCA